MTYDALDELREASAASYAPTNSRSPVDTLLSEGTVTAGALCSAYERLLDDDMAHAVAVAFTVPTTVTCEAPSRWMRGRGEDGEYLVSVHPAPGGVAVAMTVEIRGRDRTWYGAYLRHSERHGALRQQVGTSRTGRQVSLAEADQRIVTLVKRTVGHAWDHVGSSLGVAFRSAGTLALPMGSALVFPTGRVVRLGTPRSCEASPVVPITEDPAATRRLRRFLEVRPPSIYERYLLDAVRQLTLGNPPLGIAHVTMILEWFANELIHDRVMGRIRELLSRDPRLVDLVLGHMWRRQRTEVSLRDKYAYYLRPLGIDVVSCNERLWRRFVALVEARNAIVHQQAGRRDAVQDRSPTGNARKLADAARAHVETAFLVLEFCMDALVAARGSAAGAAAG